MSRQGGFTLVEAMVVVTILGILSALVGPSFRRNLQQGAVARQARVAAEMFHESRAEATATGRAMFLLIEGSPGSSAHRLIARPGPSSSCTLPAGTPASFWTTDVYYRDTETRSDAAAAVVPVDPPGSGKAAAQACLCIRPSGRLYRVDCGGGWPQVYPGRMEIRVQSAGPGPGPTYLVSVGSSSIARVQGE